MMMDLLPFPFSIVSLGLEREVIYQNPASKVQHGQFAIAHQTASSLLSLENSLGGPAADPAANENSRFHCRPEGGSGRDLMQHIFSLKAEPIIEVDLGGFKNKFKYYSPECGHFDVCTFVRH